MIGTAIVAGISAAASVAGGIMKAQEARRARLRQESDIKNMMAENAAWYSRKINQDFLERAENQSALERARAAYQSTVAMAQGRQDMLGGSNASAAATKEAAAKGMADASSQIAANASRSKDTAEEQYMSKDLSLRQKQMDADQQASIDKQANIDSAVDAVGKAASAYAAGQSAASGAASTRAANEVSADAAADATVASAPAEVTPNVNATPKSSTKSNYKVDDDIVAKNTYVAMNGIDATVKNPYEDKRNGRWSKLFYGK